MEHFIKTEALAKTPVILERFYRESGLKKSALKFMFRGVSPRNTPSGEQVFRHETYRNIKGTTKNILWIQKKLNKA